MASCLKYLVVMDPDAPQQFALTRAVSLANHSGASVVAFACCYLDEQSLLHFNSRHEAKHDARQRLEQWIYNQTSQLHGRTRISCESAWNEDCVTTACLRAQHHDACMMFLDRQCREPLQRWLDQAPTPLYLTAEGEEMTGSHPVLASIVPRCDDDTHTALNHNVLATACNLAEDTGRYLNLVCALDEREAIAEHLGFDYLENLDTVQLAIAQQYGVDPARIHLQLGPPCSVISNWAGQLSAAVLVVGNSKGKSITATLLGCMAERLLEKYPGDLLVVN